jgi:hypothetical protein
MTSHGEFQQVLTKLIVCLDKLKQTLVEQNNSNVKRKTIKKHRQLLLQAVLRIRIRDPVPFYPWIRDPGRLKSQDSVSGSGMNNPDHIS